jgi:hypothetical protein
MTSSSTATEILDCAVQYSLYSGYILFALGITGNALNILVFTQLKLFRDNRCAFYLTVDSISSFLYQFIAFNITLFTSINGNDGTGRFLVWCKLRYILAQTFVLITYSMICCAAADQFFSTNYRFNFRQFCTMKVARYLSLTLICFSIIQPSVGCLILNQIFLRYATFFVYPLLNGLLPMVIASFFSLLAFQNVRRIVRRQLPIVRRRLDRQMTAMVLIRVVFFVCLAFPYSSYRIYAINVPVSRSQPMEFAIRQLIQGIFVSVSTLIFAVQFSFFHEIHICDLFVCCRGAFMSL